MSSWRPLVLALTLAALAAAASCGGRGGTDPLTPAPVGPAPAADLPDPAGLPIAVNPEGMTSSILGLTTVSIAADLSAELTFPRSAQLQGDQYRLSVRPFFGARDIQVVSVQRSENFKDAIALTLAFTHPFPRPDDLNRPATGLKRADLHIFKPTALLLAEGAENFAFPSEFDTIQVNTKALLNPSGYLKPGALLQVDGLAANTFPYLHITPLDSDSTVTNYDPLNGGWQGDKLLDPSGYGIFAQGARHLATFELPATPGSSMSFDIAVMAEYQDPRGNADPKGNRLPDPADPTALRYILPAAAGDNSQVGVQFTELSGNRLPTDSPGAIRAMVSIIDWDNQAPVAATFPNDADLTEGKEASGTASVLAVLPTVASGVVPAIPLLVGTGAPLDPVQYELNLQNDLAQQVPGYYTGLVRVEDEQSASNIYDLAEAIGPDGQPALGAPLPEPLPSVTYQAFEVLVENALCDDMYLSVTDPNGGPLNHGDQVRVVQSGVGNGISGFWALDLVHSDALNEDPPAWSGYTLYSPWQAPLSTGTVVNTTREPRILTTTVMTGHPSPMFPCMTVSTLVEGNTPPSHPESQTITDPSGGALEDGERVRINYAGIIDPDTVPSAVTVSAKFDMNNDGVIEETKTGTAAAGGITSTNFALAPGTVKVTLTLSDEAGAIAPSPPTTKSIAGICGSYLVAFTDAGGSSTISNGESVRMTFTPNTGGTWSFDPQAFTDNMTASTNFSAVGTTGTTPVNTAVSTTKAVNHTRNPIAGAFNVPITVFRNTIPQNCASAVGTIAANAPPTCPSSQNLTDAGGGSIAHGDTVRISWSGITDSDNLTGDITVTARFDLNGDGVAEETKTANGYSGSLVSTGTVVSGATVKVFLVVADTAGPINACAPLTVTVPDACNPLALPAIGNISLATLRDGGLRGGTAANQAITGIRITWADIAGEASYAIYRATWPNGQTLTNLTFSEIGEVGANITQFNDNFADARGTRYVYRLHPRCVWGGANGNRSQYAMAALQNFEGVGSTSAQLNTPTTPLNNGWHLRYDHASTGHQYFKVTGTGTLTGTRSFEAVKVSGNSTQRFAALVPPKLTDSSFRVDGLAVSRLEFVHAQTGSWADDCGVAVLTCQDLPDNGTTPAGGTFRWAGTFLDGKPYTDQSSNVIEYAFPGVGSTHPASGAWAYGNLTNPGFSETFTAVSTASGTLSQSHVSLLIAFAALNTSTVGYKLDDIAWLVY